MTLTVIDVLSGTRVTALLRAVASFDMLVRILTLRGLRDTSVRNGRCGPRSDSAGCEALLS